MIAEHGQQQQQQPSTSNDSDDVAVDLKTPAKSETWQSQRNKDEEEKDGGASKSITTVDIENNVAEYQDQQRHLNLEVHSDDDSSSSSGSYTSTSDAEIENASVNQIVENGWLTDIKSSSSPLPLSLQHEMNGVALPRGEPLQINGDINAKNVGVLNVGNRAFYKGPVTIVYTKTTSINEDKSSLGSGDEETLQKSSNNDGPKLSNGSTHPLFPLPREKLAKWFWTKRYIIGIATLILLLIIVLIVFLTGDPTIPGVRIIPRVEWLAQPPVKPAEKLGIYPPIYVIISHTATVFCFTQSQCVLNVRVIQNFHIESRGFDDIGFNFLVGGDGLVYEGRGWDVEGAHTFNYNYKSLGISFIGTFTHDKPTKAQLYAAQKLIEYGVNTGRISKDYKLLGHRQCIKTESPGQMLYNIIMTWDHWSPKP